MDGAIVDTRALEVLGDLAGHFGLAPGAPRLQPQCRAVVALALVGLEHGAVGHLVQQVVAEDVLLRLVERALQL